MMKVLFPVVASIGFLSLLCLYLTGVGYQQESLQLGQAFGIMRYCAYAGIASVGLVVIYILWKRPKGLRFIVLVSSAVLGFISFYVPYQQQQIAGSVPAIHDISTDLVNPPVFVAVAPLRADAPNQAEYDGPEVAAQQQQAYPGINSIVYPQTLAEVFLVASAEVADMGWELVDANLGDGRIEATATTRWFGFKDDVVIRLSTDASGATVFDMRSKSRVGRSDVGVNAARIERFIDALNSELGDS